MAAQPTQVFQIVVAEAKPGEEFDDVAPARTAHALLTFFHFLIFFFFLPLCDNMPDITSQYFSQ